MIWADLIVVLACIVLGARLGGIGLGTVAALGLSFSCLAWDALPASFQGSAAHCPLCGDVGSVAAGGGGLDLWYPSQKRRCAAPPSDHAAGSVDLLSLHLRVWNRARLIFAAADHRGGLTKGEGAARAAAFNLGHCIASRGHSKSDVRRHRRNGGAALEKRPFWTDRHTARVHTSTLLGVLAGARR